MCHPPYGPGVSEHIKSTNRQPETPVHTCPFCSRSLIRGKYPKWPNQYDKSRWKKVWVCRRHGPVRQIWENHDKEVSE